MVMFFLPSWKNNHKGRITIFSSRRGVADLCCRDLQLLEARSPVDGGDADDRCRIDIGVRYCGGPEQAAFRLLAQRRIAYLALAFAF
jgi:hypothetical protein